MHLAYCLFTGISATCKKVRYSGRIIFIIPMVVIILLGISESAVLYYWFNFICIAFVADFSKSDQSIRSKEDY